MFHKIGIGNAENTVLKIHPSHSPLGSQEDGTLRTTKFRKDLWLWCRSWGTGHFRHFWPKFPFKGILINSHDPYLALLAYRNAPGRLGSTPAKLQMSRRLRTTLPLHLEDLEPRKPNLMGVCWKDVLFLDNDKTSTAAMGRITRPSWYLRLCLGS